MPLNLQDTSSDEQWSTPTSAKWEKFNAVPAAPRPRRIELETFNDPDTIKQVITGREEPVSLSFRSLYFLFWPSFYLLFCSDIRRPAAVAEVLFETRDLMFVSDPPEAFHSSSLSTSILPNNTGLCVTLKETIDPHPLHIICCDHDCLPCSHMQHKVLGGSPPCEVPLAVHWLERRAVIRLMEELHSADNPAEIAHGFPVPEVENKHTRVEYQMRGLGPKRAHIQNLTKLWVWQHRLINANNSTSQATTAPHSAQITTVWLSSRRVQNISRL